MKRFFKIGIGFAIFIVGASLHAEPGGASRGGSTGGRSTAPAHGAPHGFIPSSHPAVPGVVAGRATAHAVSRPTSVATIGNFAEVSRAVITAMRVSHPGRTVAEIWLERHPTSGEQVVKVRLTGSGPQPEISAGMSRDFLRHRVPGFEIATTTLSRVTLFRNTTENPFGAITPDQTQGILAGVAHELATNQRLVSGSEGNPQLKAWLSDPNLITQLEFVSDSPTTRHLRVRHATGAEAFIEDPAVIQEILIGAGIEPALARAIPNGSSPLIYASNARLASSQLPGSDHIGAVMRPVFEAHQTARLGGDPRAAEGPMQTVLRFGPNGFPAAEGTAADIIVTHRRDADGHLMRTVALKSPDQFLSDGEVARRNREISIAALNGRVD